MRQYLADLEEKMQAGMEGKLFDRRSRLSIYLEKFQGLSPLREIESGLFLCFQ